MIDKCTAIRVRRGVISDHEIGGEVKHGHATSYQNIHIENFHPVPVYRKHGEESKHKIGSVNHNVHVSHGYGKHDPGHATVSGSVEGHHGKEHESIVVGGHEGGEFNSLGGHEGFSEGQEYGHEEAAQYGAELGGEGGYQGYEGHEAGDEGGYEQSILHQ